MYLQKSIATKEKVDISLEIFLLSEVLPPKKAVTQCSLYATRAGWGDHPNLILTEGAARWPRLERPLLWPKPQKPSHKPTFEQKAPDIQINTVSACQIYACGINGTK